MNSSVNDNRRPRRRYRPLKVRRRGIHSIGKINPWTPKVSVPDYSPMGIRTRVSTPIRKRDESTIAIDLVSNDLFGQIQVGIDREKTGSATPVWTGPELATTSADRDLIFDGAISTQLLLEVGSREGLDTGLGAGLLTFAGLRAFRALLDKVFSTS